LEIGHSLWTAVGTKIEYHNKLKGVKNAFLEGMSNFDIGHLL